MLKELGSEFWQIELTDEKRSHWWEDTNGDCQYVMSGRTAIDFVLTDIKYHVDKDDIIAYLPSYCCDSMIIPFEKQGIIVKFYDTFDGLTDNYDLVFVLEYFGFQNNEVHNLISIEKAKGKIIIQDVTHSLLQDIPYDKNADYLIASLRKWSGFITGGFAVKLDGEFALKSLCPVLKEFYQLRLLSREMKNQYVKDCFTGSKVFLENFTSAEKCLDEYYSLYAMDDKSLKDVCFWDVCDVKTKRRRNADNLYSNLKNVSFLCDYLDGSTPIFVPIILNCKKERDALRKHLIENKIYCPVHWPTTSQYEKLQEHKMIYDTELSLICDQRYDALDIEREIKIVNEFMEGR